MGNQYATEWLKSPKRDDDAYHMILEKSDFSSLSEIEQKYNFIIFKFEPKNSLKV